MKYMSKKNTAVKNVTSIIDNEYFLQFNWDHCNDPITILVRAMLYGDPLFILQNFPIGYLKEIFLERIHLFRGPNRAFWKLVLEVEDEELDQATRRNFRETIKIWPY